MVGLFILPRLLGTQPSQAYSEGLINTQLLAICCCFSATICTVCYMHQEANRGLRGSETSLSLKSQYFSVAVLCVFPTRWHYKVLSHRPRQKGKDKYLIPFEGAELSNCRAAYHLAGVCSVTQLNFRDTS
jgi:hypothetical protein